MARGHYERFGVFSPGLCVFRVFTFNYFGDVLSGRDRELRHCDRVYTVETAYGWHC